jgi:hypothetical protein
MAVGVTIGKREALPRVEVWGKHCFRSREDLAECQVCGETIRWEHYHCGHIVDHAEGGSAEIDNLTVQCIVCNLYKPAHSTVEEYELWLKGGDWLVEVVMQLVEVGAGQLNELDLLRQFLLREGINYIEEKSAILFQTPYAWKRVFHGCRAYQAGGMEALLAFARTGELPTGLVRY